MVDQQSNLLNTYLSGYFEFLHAQSIAWIIDALDHHARVIANILPKHNRSLIPSMKMQTKFLDHFDLFHGYVFSEKRSIQHYRSHPVPSLKHANSIIHSAVSRLENHNFFSNWHSLIQYLKQKNIDPETIVTTNGCFDILHPGHVDILEKAKSLNSILIVAINGDDSVKRFKGESRPIHSEAVRALILSYVKSIDYVTVFREDTPLQLLDSLKPKYHVKGGSFIDKRINSEKELLESWNGTLIQFPMIGDYSTSHIISNFPNLKFPL